MSITSKVRQSVVLTADGQVQKLIAGAAANIGSANILSIFAQSTAADGEVKLDNEADASKTAGKLIEILKKLPRSLDGRVFPIGIKNFERSWTKICRRAGIVGLRWHDLKREAISRLFEKGLSVSEVQLFCGNSLASLEVYTEHNSTTLAEKLAYN